MSGKLTLLGAIVVGIGGAVAAGCQTYDFEPVEPLALAQKTTPRKIAGRNLKPDLMLLVDKSGSMKDRIDPSNSSSPSRWSELTSAMNGFLRDHGSVGRMGLMFYPAEGGDGCFAPTLSNVIVPLSSSNDVESELQQTASQINDAIQSANPNGGTPTGESLEVLSNYPPLQGESDPALRRQKFVIVLTDGLPNCNENNPNTFDDPAACRCTLGDDCSTNPVNGCLDMDNTVRQVATLKARDIKTIVIGFGMQNVADAPEVLNAMADAGGFPRSCKDGMDAECGGAAGSCDTVSHLCKQKFYQAANGDDLAQALAQISEIVGTGDICVYKLDEPPSDPAFLSVLVDGVNVTAGADTWTYDAGTVTFQGALCTRMRMATTNSPVDVEFRSVQGL